MRLTELMEQAGTWPMLVLANKAPQRRGLLGWLRR